VGPQGYGEVTGVEGRLADGRQLRRVGDIEECCQDLGRDAVVGTGAALHAVDEVVEDVDVVVG
jgi:hypothetical protein